MPHRVRRYRDNLRDMLHELKLMRDRGEIHVPANMSDNEFEEIMKKIDKHYEENGVILHHPLTRGRITDPSSLEHITKFFQHIYATSNNASNFRARTRNAQNRRAQAAANRMAAAVVARDARRRIEIPRAAAAAAARRTATRSAGRNAARHAALVAIMLRSTRQRTRPRSTSSSNSNSNGSRSSSSRSSRGSRSSSSRSSRGSRSSSSRSSRGSRSRRGVVV